MENKKEAGLRYNTGKLRYDLLHPVAQKGIVSVLTKGSMKYAPRNWEKGMTWSTVIASLKRHLAAFEAGEDVDIETGELHIDHIQCNAHFLSAYYKIAPWYDDRAHITAKKPKIGLDIDEVICDWVGDWIKYWGLKVPTSWFFDYKINDRLHQMKNDGVLDQFYLGLKPKIDPSEIPFEPHCYVTSRPVSTEITMRWLALYNFPLRPVITVGVGESKLEVIKKAGIDVFVDDRYDTFQELNSNGVCCYLMDAPHNARYDVGYRRLHSLKDLKF